MKHKYFFLLFTMSTMFAALIYGQNKIGNNPATINGGSLLELESTSKGLLLPRIPLDDVTKWTLDGVAVNGMLIFVDGTGTQAKGIYYWNSTQWSRVINSDELSALIVNYTTVSNSSTGNKLKTTVNGKAADEVSIINAITNTLTGNILETSVNGIKASVDLSPILTTSTTNALAGTENKLTSIVNGVSADLTPVSGSISKTLGFDTSGKLVIQNPTTTATVVSNTSKVNNISTTVNGITGVDVNIINSNSLSLVNGILSSSVNGVMSSPGLNLISSADNGLSSENGNVQLGGTLIKPTTLSATAINSLSITGLQNGNVITDSLLVVASNTGRVGKISSSVLSTNMNKLIAFASSNNQKRFETPEVITDLKKIQVYRNGINVEFTRVDDTHIDLEDQAACYVNDEIKIIQLK